jgi:CO/xanthine dehydrogenase FAD-binding subunit
VAAKPVPAMSVLVPTDLDSALAALAHEPDALVLAGGTDAMVAVNAGWLRFESVVALRAVDALKQVDVDADLGHVRIGSGVTYTRLLADDVVATVPALAQAARTVGSPQIRNAGTIGGNLATASPAGDTLPVLVALDATVEVASVAGRRTVPVHELLTGPKRTSLGPRELITAVTVPLVRGHQEYRKVGVRNAMVIAVASVAAVVDLDRRSVAIGLGSVGPVPLRAPAAEAWLAGRLRWDDDGVGLEEPADLERFAEMVGGAARPIDDHRGTATYRRHAVGVMAGRCLRAALR